MNELLDEAKHPCRRKEDQQENASPSNKNYWDFRNNHGNIYIIPSDKLEELLAATAKKEA